MKDVELGFRMRCEWESAGGTTDPIDTIQGHIAQQPPSL